MGRPQKPLEQHKLNGNPSKIKNLPDPIDVPRDRPLPPEHYGETHVAAWDFFTDAIASMGVLSSIDAVALEMLCDSWIRYRENEAFLRSSGDTMDNGRGPTIRPEFRARKSLYQEVMQSLGMFGFTPVARANLARTYGKKSDEPSALEALLAKRRQDN